MGCNQAKIAQHVNQIKSNQQKQIDLGKRSSKDLYDQQTFISNHYNTKENNIDFSNNLVENYQHQDSQNQNNIENPQFNKSQPNKVNRTQILNKQKKLSYSNHKITKQTYQLTQTGVTGTQQYQQIKVNIKRKNQLPGIQDIDSKDCKSDSNKSNKLSSKSKLDNSVYMNLQSNRHSLNSSTYKEFNFNQKMSESQNMINLQQQNLQQSNYINTYNKNNLKENNKLSQSKQQHNTAFPQINQFNDLNLQKDISDTNTDDLNQPQQQQLIKVQSDIIPKKTNNIKKNNDNKQGTYTNLDLEFSKQQQKEEELCRIKPQLEIYKLRKQKSFSEIEKYVDQCQKTQLTSLTQLLPKYTVTEDYVRERKLLKEKHDSAIPVLDEDSEQSFLMVKRNLHIKCLMKKFKQDQAEQNNYKIEQYQNQNIDSRLKELYLIN